MEKLTPLTDSETSAIWEMFRDTPMKDLIQQGDDRMEELRPLSPELLSVLEKAALEAAFVQGSVNFLFLYLLLLRRTGQRPGNFFEQAKAAGWNKTALVQQLEYDDAGTTGIGADHRPPCPCCGGRMIIVETFERCGAPRAPPSPDAGGRTAMP